MIGTRVEAMSNTNSFRYVGTHVHRQLDLRQRLFVTIRKGNVQQHKHQHKHQRIEKCIKFWAERVRTLMFMLMLISLSWKRNKYTLHPPTLKPSFTNLPNMFLCLGFAFYTKLCSSVHDSFELQKLEICENPKPLKSTSWTSKFVFLKLSPDDLSQERFVRKLAQRVQSAMI